MDSWAHFAIGSSQGTHGCDQWIEFQLFNPLVPRDWCVITPAQRLTPPTHPSGLETTLDGEQYSAVPAAMHVVESGDQERLQGDQSAPHLQQVSCVWGASRGDVSGADHPTATRVLCNSALCVGPGSPRALGGFTIQLPSEQPLVEPFGRLSKVAALSLSLSQTRSSCLEVSESGCARVELVFLNGSTT
jgi:hypothetical protein